MEQIERVIRLHNLLSQARYPIARKLLEEKLSCSQKTVRRDIDFLRDRLGAPLEYDKENNGWFYRPNEAALYELPGLWLNEQEIHALLTIKQLLTSFDPDLLQEEMAPFEKRIRTILEKTTDLSSNEDIGQYIQLLSSAKRKQQYKHYQAIASATISKKQIYITYYGRGKNKRSKRTLSPQQLVHYKDNWYLSAWCHEKEAMRIFSLDKIETLKLLTEPSKKLVKNSIQDFISSSFGIFSGTANEHAILEFNEESSRWVADEIWHPEQQGEWLDNECYQLTIPYSNMIELAGEILRHGEDIIVKSPDTLKNYIKKRLTLALKNY